jgi:predicted phosphatase
MKLLAQLFFVLGCFFSSEFGLYAKQPDHKSIIQTKVNRKNVQDISAIKIHAHSTEKIAFFIDADEVLFTTTIVNGVPTLVRLYDDLEGVFSEIRKRGHQVFILTYNKAEEIRRKLLVVKLDESYFDGILSCEMQGDILTSKGSLLRKFVKESKTKFGSFVFIDNFPPFVTDVEKVAQELNLKLHSYVCTGYIDLYHKYVYYHLRKLQEGVANGKGYCHELTRIQKSLAKYRIDISRFSEQYPTYESFKRFAVDQALIWPYLTYL